MSGTAAPKVRAVVSLLIDKVVDCISSVEAKGERCASSLPGNFLAEDWPAGDRGARTYHARSSPHKCLNESFSGRLLKEDEPPLVAPKMPLG
jgi:hypothetical protein